MRRFSRSQQNHHSKPILIIAHEWAERSCDWYNEIHQIKSHNRIQ
jgi:hypothetical protein